MPDGRGSIRVFSASLDVSESRLRRLRESLSGDERARAERFVFEVHRRRFTAARGLLREVLAGELGIPPAAVRFDYGPRGKPALARDLETELRFNVSHAQERALLAVARGLELGVDIEAVREGIDTAAIAKRFFSPKEGGALLALPEAARADAFFTIWTRKEAYVKLLGGGLAIPLDSFDVSLGEPARLLRSKGGEAAAEQVALLSLTVPTGFRAALAVAGEPAAVEALALE